jgi:ribosomal protein S18 acetylase RimI-like enzyme
MPIRQFDFDRDYDAACDLWRNAGVGVQLRRSDTPAEIQKKLARDPDLFLVAEADGRVIGTVIGGFDGRRGMIYHLAVAADYRRQGLGEQLMNEVEERLRQKGCVKIYLQVVPENEEAMHYYEKRGWQRMQTVLYGKELQ